MEVERSAAEKEAPACTPTYAYPDASEQGSPKGRNTQEQVTETRKSSGNKPSKRANQRHTCRAQRKPVASKSSRARITKSKERRHERWMCSVYRKKPKNRS